MAFRISTRCCCPTDSWSIRPKGSMSKPSFPAKSLICFAASSMSSNCPARTISLPSGPTECGRPARSRLAATCALGDRLQLPGCHVRRRLLDLVFKTCRNGVEVPDHRGPDAAVRGVVRVVARLLAFVLEALDPVPDRDLQVLFGAGDDAGLGIGKRQVLIHVNADAVDFRAACGAERAGAGEAGHLEDGVDPLSDQRLR